MVEVGTTLTVRRHEGKEKFTIVGSEEVDMANRRISFRHHLASLLGKGSSVMVDTPRGKPNTPFSLLTNTHYFYH